MHDTCVHAIVIRLSYQPHATQADINKSADDFEEELRRSRAEMEVLPFSLLLTQLHIKRMLK